MLLSSCNPARRVPDGQYLLDRNRIEIEDAEIKRSELTNYFRQRPNRRILGLFRFHLGVNQMAGTGRDNRLRSWMRYTIGEPPVIYDAGMTNATRRQFELYLHSKGYFNADVEFEEQFRRKRARITYSITGNQPYTINKISYTISDAHVKGFVLSDTIDAFIQRGQRYDADNLQNERNRITRNLRNSGFFRFSRDFVFFQVDSNLNNHQVNIDIIINDPANQPMHPPNDSLKHERHKRFIINQVKILPEYDPLLASMPKADTTFYKVTDRRREREFEYLFIHSEPLRINPDIIVNHLMLRPGNFFSIRDVEQSYQFLSDLRNFRSINLRFAENTDLGDIPATSDTIGYLNATVQLTRSPANAFTIEAEGLNTAGNLGVAGNLLFQNRNIFRGAEIFNLRLKGALEVSGESVSEEVFQRLPFNTLELGVEAGIDFPKLLVPLPIERLSRNSRPKSSIVTGINFRQRPDYTRYLFNVNYGFEWNETSQKRHFIYPIEISSVRVYNDSILRASIPDENPFILSRFRDHLVPGLKYTYVYNTQVIGVPVDFSYLRANFESAGNLMRWVADGLDLTQDENGAYRIFNIPFSQFVKADADYRFYRVFDDGQSLVFRVMGGVGVPYGNVDVLPFIKSYYGGGSNGLRAWRIYSLGPGGYQGQGERRFDRYGDIKLEANVEYRFRLYGFWNGAFFIDAGNVWFVRKNDRFPGGEFRFSQLGNDIAIGGGFGLRLDFSFFIFRMDAAVPIKDPSFPFQDQWISGWPPLRNFNFNLGIGYPF